MTETRASVKPLSNKLRLDAALWYVSQDCRVWLAHFAQRGPDGIVRCSCSLAEKCKRPGKHPFGKRWPERAVGDADGVRIMFDSFVGADALNYCVVPNDSILILDLDRKKDKDGVAWLCYKLGITEAELAKITTCQRTPSGGYHLIFRRRTLFPHKIAVNLWPGIDLPIQVIGAACERPDGLYTFANQVAPVAEPEWLTAMIVDALKAEATRREAATHARHVRAAKRKAAAKSERGDDVTRDEVITHLKRINPDCAYTRWFQVLCAVSAAPLFDETDLEQATMEIARAWSRGDYHPNSNPDYDSDTFDLIWKSINPEKEGGTRYGTLVAMARPNLLAQWAAQQSQAQPETKPLDAKAVMAGCRAYHEGEQELAQRWKPGQGKFD